MKQLKRKLCSNAGASMIIAMVFLLFCMMIGGSILAVSMANATRVADRTSEQQEQLDQHSAATVLAELLSGYEEVPLQLVIEKVEVKTGENDPSYTYRFLLPITETKKPAIQRFVFEYVMDQYMRMEMGSGGVSNPIIGDLVGFDFVDLAEKYSYGVPSVASGNSQTIAVEDPYGNQTNAILNLDPDSIYPDMRVRFEGVSQVEVFVDCLKSAVEKNSITRGNTKTTTTTTIVCWADPVILKTKGGGS